MSKAYLVMDMPDKCGECSLRMGMTCSPVLKDIDSVDEKTHWCPLRELPQKKERDFVKSDYEGGYSHGFVGGYNACIDEIARGSEENGINKC